MSAPNDLSAGGHRTEAPAGDPACLQIAYLCNVYPAISHSFVRREIEGLIADSVARVEQGAQLVNDTGTTMEAILRDVTEVTVRSSVAFQFVVRDAPYVRWRRRSACSLSSSRRPIPVLK